MPEKKKRRAGIKRKNNAYVGINKLKELPFSEAEANLGSIKVFSLPKDKETLFTDKVSFIGLKMEVDRMGSPILMGVYEKNYHSISDSQKMLIFLKNIIKDCQLNKKIICHFDEADSILLMKVMIEYAKLDDEKIINIGKRITYGVNGKFNKKMGWIIDPLIEIKLKTGEKIGVSSYLNGCLGLFFENPEGEMYRTTTYKSKHFWQGDKKESAKKAKISYWDKINEEEKTKGQNYYQSRLACDLMKRVDQLFYREFKEHPKTYFSAGSLAESIIHKFVPDGALYGFSLSQHMNKWQEKGIDGKTIENVIHMAFDANKGAIIEHEVVGRVWYGGNADIGASYPAIMRYALPTLAGSTVEYRKDIKEWKDVPKADLKNIVLLTCEFYIPDHVRHTILIKNPIGAEYKRSQDRTSILGHGHVVATAHYHEVAFLLSQIPEEEHKNVILEIKEVCVIHTTGKLSIISKIIQKLWDLRMKLKKAGKDSEYIVKLIMNAIYGKFFQCYQQYSMYGVDKLEFIFEGFDAGFMFNPIYSSLITAFARIRIQEGALNIEKNGGEVVSILTDCVKYMKEDEIIHAPDLLDKSFPSILKDFEGLEENGWKEEKTLGWFEKPVSFEQGLFMPKTGVYEYCLLDSMEEKWEVKTSGYQKFDNKFENSSYIGKKLEEFMFEARNGVDFINDSFNDDLYLKFGKYETTSFTYLSDKHVVYETLGMTLWREIPFRVRVNEMLPKRYYTGETDLSLFNIGKDYLFRTESPNLDDYIGFDGLAVDDRKIKVRELVKLITNEEIAAKRKEKRKESIGKYDKKRRENEKLLAKQINENIEKFPFKKFGIKKGSYEGNNVRDFGIEGTKELIINAGLTPVI